MQGTTTRARRSSTHPGSEISSPHRLFRTAVVTWEHIWAVGSLRSASRTYGATRCRSRQKQATPSRGSRPPPEHAGRPLLAHASRSCYVGPVTHRHARSPHPAASAGLPWPRKSEAGERLLRHLRDTGDAPITVGAFLGSPLVNIFHTASGYSHRSPCVHGMVRTVASRQSPG